jgi:hypothetical protein
MSPTTPAPAATPYALDNDAPSAPAVHLALAEVLDPVTFDILDRYPPPLGGRCLELGAGGGSVAREMAKLVGAEGYVLATDIKTRRRPAAPRCRTPGREHPVAHRHPVSLHPPGGRRRDQYQPAYKPAIAAAEIDLMRPYVRRGVVVGSLDDVRVMQMIALLVSIGEIPRFTVTPEQVIALDKVPR